MLGKNLLQLFLDALDTDELSDEYADRRKAFECLDRAASIFARETGVLTASVDIATAADTQAYDLPPDFINLYMRNRRGHHFIRITDADGNYSLEVPVGDYAVTTFYPEFYAPIGTSNVTVPKLELILRDARIKPAVNEMEQHPHFQQPELYEFVRANGIVPIGFAPIGSPTRPDRDKTEDDTVDIEDPSIVGPAKRLGVHPAVICVKWGQQRGQIPIPFSVRRNEYLSNLQGVVQDPLTDEEMAAIASADRGCRLIKGQVFLWKDGQTWEDLWDLDGVITPP